ncbi:unnamed protein product [Penicillium egyptiacum]|uniref:Uncharacterized protein n=1 Tax=Penicillium egyptiacum TaxID=1303716 RepID=A0A9W4KEP0_9EURO|nr:unnamed protein product [Penicillium egyptiacum]
MAGRHPLTQVPDLVGASGNPSREADMALSPYPALLHDVAEAYEKFAGYANIIAKGGPLAPQFGDSLFYSEVERTAARIFGEPRPRLVEGDSNTLIEWTDVLRELLTPGDFQRQANGMYRCRVRGSLIEVSEANYIEILTGVTERLLQPLQNLSDEQKETRVRLKLSAYLHQTHQTLLQFATAVQTSIDALNTPPTIHDANPSSTGRDQAQLRTPMSARQPVSSSREVICISDTESDTVNKSSANIKQEAPESGQSEPPEIVRRYMAEVMQSHTQGRIKSGSSEVLQNNSIEQTSDTNDYDYVPSTDVFRSNSTGSASSTGDYASSLDVSRGNSNDSANGTNDNAGYIAYGILRLVASLVNDNNADAELVDNNSSALNDPELENTDANGNINSNANIEPSGLTSEMASDTIRPWLSNINAPGNEDDDAQSFGSDIPF